MSSKGSLGEQPPRLNLQSGESPPQISVRGGRDVALHWCSQEVGGDREHLLYLQEVPPALSHTDEGQSAQPHGLLSPTR